MVFETLHVQLDVCIKLALDRVGSCKMTQQQSLAFGAIVHQDAQLAAGHKRFFAADNVGVVQGL